jgi:diguanylate cyclase
MVGDMRAGVLLSDGCSRLARPLVAVAALLCAVHLSTVFAGPGGPPAAAAISGDVGDAVVVLAAVLCLLRAGSGGRDRGAWACAGAGLTAWLVGSTPGAGRPGELATLAFFPCAYVALAIVGRPRRRARTLVTWLDGSIRALAVAAASALVLTPPAATAGGLAQAAIALARPVGDVVLLGLVAAALTLDGRGVDRGLGLLGAGLALLAAADGVSVLEPAAAAHLSDSVTDAGCSLGALLVAAGAWQRPPRRRRALDAERRSARTPTALLASAGVAVLAIDVFVPVNALAGLTAAGAMSVIVLRLAVAGRQQRALERNRILALTDDLTGLANRRAFYAHAEDRIAAAIGAGRSTVLLLIDLDRFKELNDTLGHAAGDDLLRQLAERLTRVMPASALLSRLGGDEFVVLMPAGSGADAARTAARRLREALEEPFELDGLRTSVRASVGAAIAPVHGADRATLLRHADIAMYSAKARRTDIEIYAPDEDEHSRERIALGGRLPDAMELDELVLHFQPKVELTTGRVTGVEALVRWRHPERGLLGPREFLPLAEQHGLMHRMTLHVLGLALRQQAAWRRGGVELQTAVNISAANLLDPRFPVDVADLVARHRAPAGSLVFELTEDTVMADPERALDALAQLGELGVGLALDDFGTGYSSLAQLKRLPVQELKIDRSFVLDMVADSDDAVIVRSTVELARNLGLRVVAEGVETAAAYEQLARYGCHAVQGYHVSGPLPAPQLVAWLRRWEAAGAGGAGDRSASARLAARLGRQAL